MTSVIRLSAAIFVVLCLAFNPVRLLAETPAKTAPVTSQKSEPAAKPPAVAEKPQPAAKPVLKPAAPPITKPVAEPPAKAPPPPPPAAPRAPVDVKPVPAFLPPGPPPLDDTALHAPVLALLKAVQTANAEGDAARWIDAGPCWVWVGMKRDQAWSKYRFSYNGSCKQGRADGQGQLKAESQDAQGKWATAFEYEATFLSGVPLGGSGESNGAKLVLGLGDRTVLSWMGPSLNEETEVFTISQADDQGRAAPCQSQSILAIAKDSTIGGERFKHLLRRSVSVANAQCPERVRNLWLASLAAMEQLTVSSRQGVLYAEPLRAQAEIREGLIYDYGQRFAALPPLVSDAAPVQGAPSLQWVPPIDELDHRLLLVMALPVFLLLLLLVAMRIAYASTRNVMVQVQPPKPVKPKPAAPSQPRLFR